MQKLEYNGWYNYETWCANLWMTNDSSGAQELEESAIECVQGAIDSDESDIQQAAISVLADRLEKQFETYAEEWMPDQSSVFADFLNAAIGEVNWHEIARHAVKEIPLYSAGWNMPGYMPDNPPAVFLDADDALEYISDAAKRDIDEQTDTNNDEKNTMSDAVDTWGTDSNGEIGVTFQNLHYFVTKS